MKKLLLLITLFTLHAHHSTSQWQQLPNLPVSGTVYDMFFVNANTGLITVVSPYNLIKTTNGGANWFVVPTDSLTRPAKMQFFNDTLGIGMGQDPGFVSYITKTTNCGLNWTRINSSSSVYQDIDFVNKDTGWVSGWDGFNDRVWRTTDGGVSFQSQYSNPGGGGLDRLFMLREKVNGANWGWLMGTGGATLYRTTNSGFNWTLISGLGGGCQSSYDIYFKDTAYGIVTRNFSCFSLTTNGGYNWTHVYEFGSVNSAIGVGDSNIAWLTMGTQDTLMKTYNFFQTYGKQVTAAFATAIFALDTSYVYAGRNQTNMMKTTNGGGPLVGLEQISNIIPEVFSLGQNYPNPFNPQTSIEFSLSKNAYVTLIIYDMLGKAVSTALDNEYITSGVYKALLDFGKLNVSSGAYFYKITITEGSSKTLFTETKKLVYIK